MPNSSIVLAFDAYGTLLSTESIAKKLATYVGEEKAKTIAVTHRKYQLEYTWRANCMGQSLIMLFKDYADQTQQAYTTISPSSPEDH